ncbi:MAG: hypothetical protein ACOVLE_09645, partial [Pirellula staleyi]
MKNDVFAGCSPDNAFPANRWKGEAPAELTTPWFGRSLTLPSNNWLGDVDEDMLTGLVWRRAKTRVAQCEGVGNDAERRLTKFPLDLLFIVIVIVVIVVII